MITVFLLFAAPMPFGERSVPCPPEGSYSIVWVVTPYKMDLGPGNRCSFIHQGAVTPYIEGRWSWDKKGGILTVTELDFLAPGKHYHWRARMRMHGKGYKGVLEVIGMPLTMVPD